MTTRMTPIEGWKVTYAHPGGNYGGQLFARSHAELEKEKDLDGR